MANMQYIADNLVEDVGIMNGLIHIDNDDTYNNARECCITSDGYIVVTEGTNGINTYSIDGVGVFTHVDNDATSHHSNGCALTADGYIVIANGADGVDTYSHVAGVLTHVDNDPASGEARGCCVTTIGGEYIVVADGANGVDTYSHVAGVLTHVDNEPTSIDANACAVTLDGYIVIADGSNGVDTYSHVAGVLTHVFNDDQGGTAHDCSVTSDGYIIIANGANGVDTYSHLAGTLTHIDNDTTPIAPVGCHGIASDGYIVIADGTSGILMYSQSAGVLTYIDQDWQGPVSLAGNSAITSDGYIVVANATRGIESYRFDYIEPTATYPITNLYNNRPGKPLVTSTTIYGVVVDFTAATALTGVAILGHNIDSGATVKLEGNATNTWESPSKTETISHVATNMYKIFTTGSYRYWRLTITGAAADIKIGEFVLGVVATLTNNYQWGSEKAKRYKNITQTTEYGQPWSNYLYNQRNYSLTFAVNDTTVTELETLQEDVQGGNKPFTFFNWDSEAVYVRMEDELNFKRTYTNYNESKIDLIEIPLGKDI